MPNYAVIIKCLVFDPGTKEDAIEWLKLEIGSLVTVVDVDVKELEDQDAIARFERGEP